MSPEAQVLLSGSLTFGVPLALAARELLILRRGRGGGWRPGPRPARQPPKPRGNAPAIKTLPACLVPVLPRSPAWREQERERVSEPA